MASFPMTDNTWKAMVNKVKEVHPDGENIVKAICSDKADLAEVMIPQQPIFLNNMNAIDKIKAVQKYLNQLQYNHTGTQFYEVKMNRSISRLFDVAKNIINFPLPIKCLEAVVVALYLTASISNISRFTIRFKSHFGKTTHRHIVLGICHNSKYGALGLSRRDILMDKPVKYNSLSQLILNFKQCYAECCHQLKKVKISATITTDLHSCDQIHWNHYVLSIGKLTDEETKCSLEKYSRELRTKSFY